MRSHRQRPRNRWAFGFAGALCLMMFISTDANAKLNVVATSPDLGALVAAVGGPEVSVDVLAKGTQNLHSLETKPSYMSRLSRADLLVANGLALEIGWLPLIVRGARQPKLNPGEVGFLDFGTDVQPLEVISGSISRAEGDVHPEGNPHWTLDPIRLAKAARKVADRLGQLDQPNAPKYNERAKVFAERMEVLTSQLAARIKATGIKNIVAYHKTLAYFAERFDLKIIAQLEPKPGISPSAGHVLQVVKSVREKNVRLILVEHYYDAKAAEKVVNDLKGVFVRVIPVSVDAQSEIKTNEDLFEAMVKTIESATEKK